MFTGIDHLMIAVSDLDQGMEQYRRLGFDVAYGGEHPGRGTHNAIAFNADDYLELIAVRDEDEYRRTATYGTLPAFIRAGGGIRYIIIQSDNLKEDVSAMRLRGVDVGDPIEGSRRTPAGVELHWRAAMLGAANPLPLFFIEHLTPLAVRRGPVPPVHPNRVFKLERTYVVVDDVAASAPLYAKVLGIAQPPLERGTVIMADMSVFQIGPCGLGIAQTYASGVAADALARRGPGPFQALYRTTSIGATDRWMGEHGLPKLPRGIRNTGEQAMLAPPDLAGGAYIGFVGPE
jgi:Glyoxalase-like domain